MRPLDVIWNHDDPRGNVAHIAQHGLTTEDVEAVLHNPEAELTSRGSGRPLAFGYTPDGRYICVIYEWVDDVTAYPVTAFEVED